MEADVISLAECRRLKRHDRPAISRSVLIEDGFTLGEAGLFELKLKRLSSLRKDREDVVVMVFASCGGDIDAAYHLRGVIDKLTSRGVTVEGLAVESCMAAAFYVFQACEPRRAYPWAQFALHDHYVWTRFTADTEPHLAFLEIMKGVTRVTKARERMLRDLSARLTHMRMDEILQIMRESKVISAQEALALGLIDEVVR